MGDSESEQQPIPDEAELWRRIRPEWVVPGKDGEPRPTSQAFQNLSASGQMSVHLADVVRARGQSASGVLAGMPGFGLVSLTAGLVRQHGQVIEEAPETADPSHAHVIGAKRKPTRRAFAKAAEWVVKPTGL